MFPRTGCVWHASLETQQKFVSAKCDIILHLMTSKCSSYYKTILELTWIVQPHKINILIEFSFIYYFFNRAKSKPYDCKRRQFYHPLCT